MNTLHLSLKVQNAHETNRIFNLFSLTRNSFSSPMARSTGRIMNHKTHTKKGQVTLLGLSKGYIQASPHYPANTLHIVGMHGEIYVQGTNRDGQYISKRFTKLKDARKYLKITI